MFVDDLMRATTTVTSKSEVEVTGITYMPWQRLGPSPPEDGQVQCLYFAEPDNEIETLKYVANEKWVRG